MYPLCGCCKVPTDWIQIRDNAGFCDECLEKKGLTKKEPIMAK